MLRLAESDLFTLKKAVTAFNSRFLGYSMVLQREQPPGGRC